MMDIKCDWIWKNHSKSHIWYSRNTNLKYLTTVVHLYARLYSMLDLQ